jgi:carbonic anhydrase/acetyltransferase-like protein (isoleucine patch superfamily)
MSSKYKLIPLKRESGLFRIQATGGVPSRGIRRGTKGGIVSGPDVLSHEGTCWIGQNARVIGGSVSENAIIIGDAEVVNSYVAGDAVISGYTNIGPHVLVQDKAVISDNASVIGTESNPATILEEASIKGRTVVRSSHVSGNSTISDHAVVVNSEVSGKSIIKNAAKINSSTVAGSIISDSTVSTSGKIFNSSISDAVEIENSSLWNCKFTDGARAFGSDLTGVTAEQRAVIRLSNLTDSQISGAEEVNNQDGTGLLLGSDTWNDFINESRARIGHSPLKSKELPSPNGADFHNVKAHLETLESIEQKYEEYTTDIVNIITFPVMTDMTNDYTRNLVRVLSKARRYADANDAEKLPAIIDDLEDAFLMAESNARKIRDSHMDVKHQKKLKDAEQMFALALNDGADEHERESSYRAGMSALRGVVDVPEKAVIALKGRIGLKELTA